LTTPSRWRRAAPWLLATLGYVAFTVVQTWPLVPRINSVLPHDLGDPALNTWIIWWNAHTLPFTEKWWNAPAFWPSNGTLAFSETLLGLSPLTTPIQWLGWSPVVAYNVAFLVTFPLSALAAHALVRRLTGRHDAGVIAGLVYGFHPFRVAHFPQIQVMTSYWMPLGLLALHAYLEKRKLRWLVAFAVAWLMQALSNGYYLLFFPVLVGIWMLWFAARRPNWRAFAAIATAFVVASLPLVPLLWVYRRIHNENGFQRLITDVGTFAADVTSLLDASPQLKFWHLEAFHQPEGELFPGLTAAVLVLLLALHWLGTSSHEKPPRAVAWLLLGSIVFASVALSAVVIGPWTIEWGGRTLVSVRVVSKPLSIAALLLVLALALVPRLQNAWRRRSPLMFYVLATGLMYLLCFGPQPHFLGTAFMYRGPYSLLMMLPGFDAVRAPARFAMLAALCLSVVAAMTFVRLTHRWRWYVRSAVLLLVVCGIIVDSAVGEMTLRDLPPQLIGADTTPAGAAVLELPLGDIGGDALAMYRGMYHGHPVVNGYSGFFPKSYDVLRHGFELRIPETFDGLTARGPILVLLDPARDSENAWRKQLEHRSNTTFVGERSGWMLYSLSGSPLPKTTSTNRLHVEHISANVNPNKAQLAIDGDSDTRWDTEWFQEGDEVVTVDLGAAERHVDSVSLTLGSHPADFPRLLVIDTSDDGLTWSTQWTGSGVVAAFNGAVRDPRDLPLVFSLPHVPARWIRLRQLGRDREFYWSIFELNVFGE
jgi:hypothetical protein